MIGLGFDPGLTPGAAMVHDRSPGGPLILWAVTIRTKPADGSPPVRSRLILRRLGLELANSQRWPEVAGVEDQRGVIVGQTRERQTNADALHGLLLQGYFHGWIVGHAPHAPLEVHEIQPKHVKIALAGLGAGSASKAQIRRVVAALDRADGVKPQLSEHAADAVGIALAAIRLERQRRLGIR